MAHADGITLQSSYSGRGTGELGAGDFPDKMILLLVLCWSLMACSGGRNEIEAQWGETDIERGAELIKIYGCGACHQIPGIAGAQGLVGPSLKGMAHRAYIGGVLPNRYDKMVEWLVNPQAIDPRTVMPDLGLDQEEAEDIAAYLYTLK